MDDKRSPSLAYAAPRADRAHLAIAAQGCQACDLYKLATQAVFGEGPTPAKMMLVGEQPSERDDELGRPFLGAEGQLLDEALAEAEIPRDQLYITHAVKHVRRGPHQDDHVHSKPTAIEIYACRGWLEREIALVRPEVIVCLGATAAQALLGPTFRLTRSHGVLEDGGKLATHILATFHPSAILRMHPDDEEYARVCRALSLDLAEAASVVTFRAERQRPHARTATAP